jgi:hypothetical protein
MHLRRCGRAGNSRPRYERSSVALPASMSASYLLLQGRHRPGDVVADHGRVSQLVSTTARVWLNGRSLGAHEGAYLPFELAARRVRRRGVHELGADSGLSPDAGLENYIVRAARLAKATDPTRLAALDVGFPGPRPREPAFAELDALGVNQYFGYTYSTVQALGPSLDVLRQTYPEPALFITEFGAEANRHGSAREVGTYEFQAEFLRSQLGAIAQKPYINGAQVWALREFAVTPGWAGGNPFPSPPFHKKGLVGLHGELKLAFGEVAALFRGTPATRAR